MKDETITRRGYFFVALCGVVILLLYAVVGFVQVRWLQAHRAETIQSRQLLLQGGATQIIKPAPDIKAQHEVKPVEVVVGIYVNRMGEFAVKEAIWTADFDIWFRWAGTSVNPGETFRLVNGEIETRERHEAYTSGEEHYARYRVKARVGKYFDPVRFPFADDRLTIEIEDSVHRVETLRYVADAKDSAISPTAILQPTLKIGQSVAAVKAHDYGSARGHSGRQAGSSDVYSQFIFAALVSHPGGAFHIKLFYALFVSVAIALLVFFIKPTHVDPRFGLGVGAMFAAIGNIIVVGAFLPRAEQPTLPDMVNTIGLVTIFFTLLQSTISLYLFDTCGHEKLSRLFDHVSFVVFFIGYTVVNLLLPISAG